MTSTTFQWVKYSFEYLVPLIGFVEPNYRVWLFPDYVLRFPLLQQQPTDMVLKVPAPSTLAFSKVPRMAGTHLCHLYCQGLSYRASPWLRQADGQPLPCTRLPGSVQSPPSNPRRLSDIPLGVNWCLP